MRYWIPDPTKPINPLEFRRLQGIIERYYVNFLDSIGNGIATTEGRLCRKKRNANY